MRFNVDLSAGIYYLQGGGKTLSYHLSPDFLAECLVRVIALVVRDRCGGADGNEPRSARSRVYMTRGSAGCTSDAISSPPRCTNVCIGIAIDSMSHRGSAHAVARERDGKKRVGCVGRRPTESNGAGIVYSDVYRGCFRIFALSIFRLTPNASVRRRCRSDCDIWPIDRSSAWGR